MDASSATVSFRVRYAVRRGDQLKTGVVENTVRVTRADAGFQITAIQEKKIGRSGAASRPSANVKTARAVNR